MNKAEIVKTVSGKVGRAGLRLKKYGPEILVVVGVVGVVSSAVMACKATTKAGDILEEAREKLDNIHEAEELGKVRDVDYTLEDAKKDTTIVYVRTGLKFAKLYGPSVILGALSITSILASNNILRKRNVALGAAYAAIDKSFKEYRGRVVERFGDAVDRELKYNIKAQKIDDIEVDPETGKEKKVKKTINVVGSDLECSPYAKFFDEGSEYYEKDPERNLFFLRAEQNYANDKLRARGYLTLNEVYERLGIPTTKAGQIVGWVYDLDKPNGDNYVDFGIYDIYREKNRDFVNGYERSILLDFNVDGDILDLISSHQR